MMTEQRMLELRGKVWSLAQSVLTDTANTRAAMPSLVDEEYEYAREFMLEIAKSTCPRAYRDDLDDESERDTDGKQP